MESSAGLCGVFERLADERKEDGDALPLSEAQRRDALSIVRGALPYWPTPGFANAAALK